jgi:hypothetical protein
MGTKHGDSPRVFLIGVARAHDCGFASARMASGVAHDLAHRDATGARFHSDRDREFYLDWLRKNSEEHGCLAPVTVG